MNYLFAVCVSLFLVTMVEAHVHNTTIFCTTNVTKCEMANINITCYKPKSGSCVDEVIAGKADLTLASANDMVKNAEKLKIVVGLKLKDLDAFVQYYGLAVVKNGTSFNLKELKGKDSCHTGVGRTVGWNIPVGYLLFIEEMTFTKNQYKSAADFFGKSCAYGINKKKVAQEVKNELCSLCNGTGAIKCTSDDPYAGYEGAFKCMADGNKDRVGFVKQTTAGEVFKKNPGEYGSKGDYQLLCKDGTKKALDQYKECNIDKRPASAFVVKKDTSDDTVKNYKEILTSARVSELVKGGLVSNDTESLKDYSNSVKDYVGDYGKHYNALSGPESGAASIIASFALQVAAVLALALLV